MTAYVHPSGFVHGGPNRKHPCGDPNCREAVVIDPSDDDQIILLHYALLNHGWRADAVADTAGALREFASPTPPKPDEPTGLGALVEANFETDEGKGFGPAHWAKAGDGSWACLTDGLTSYRAGWPFLTNVRVLSEGVTE